MTYQETIDWMFSQLPMYQRQGKTAFKKDLTNISAFCDELKNPQNKFASIVKEVEAMKEHQKQSKDQIENLFNALMQKAFKGELKC